MKLLALANVVASPFALNSDNSPADIKSMEHYGVQVMMVGHFMMMEDPDRFNRLLKTAIDKLTQ